MMTQSVITQAANLFGSATGSVTTKGKKSGSGFDLLIENSLKTGESVKENTENATTKKTSFQTTKTESSTSDATDQTTEQTDSVANNDTVKTQNTANTQDTKTTELNSKQTSDGAKTKQTTETDGTELTENEQLMEQITGMLQSIREVVMDVLNVSTEELDQLMSEQGLSTVDLLQSENLQQLVLTNNGETDILSVLTDENMAASLQELLQTVDGIKETANLQIPDEQMKSILLQITNEAKTSEVTTQEQFITETSQTPEDNLTNQKEEKVGDVTQKKDEKTTDDTSQKDTKAEIAKVSGNEADSTNTQSDARREDGQELKAEDQFQTFINNLAKTTQNTETDFTGNLVQVTEIREIANQIIERIKVSIQPDQTSMELQLNPESLGKVNLSVQSKNGIMTAQFVVQNEITKEAIEGQLHILRDTLNQQGIKVEAIEVTVSAYAFDQNSNQGSDNQAEEKKSNSGRKITMDEALGMTELPEEEITAQDLAGVKGSQIDYTA